MSRIIIGKHTLESLTSGMYADSFVVFREYIQNSVDSIDEAVRCGLLDLGEEKITVRLSPSDRQIVITDNGLGIPACDAEKTLVSIGNSKKKASNSRGFRGIGRLSALSYCNCLTFTTSFRGESVATRITIDASKLAQVLADDSQEDVTMLDVLKCVYSVEHLSEKEDEHYFSVKLDGVDDNSKLLSYSDVEGYLAQNAPVPYRPDFIWGKEIVRRLRNEGFEIRAYNLSLEYGTKVVPIYKSYRDEFTVDKGKNLKDQVQDIVIIRVPSENAPLAAIGWLAKTNYKGSIYDKSIKGIRLRKGNILVGDYQTLNVVFKDARFNGWSVGEIFAIDNQLIPNARRDNFEKNPAYFALFEYLKTIAANITKEIRAESLRRNAKLSSAIEQLDIAAQETQEAICSDLSGARRGQLTKKLREAHAAVSKSNVNGDTEQYYQNIAFAELDMLIGKLQGATKYKALNTLDSLTNTEKRILERVIQTIDALEIDGADIIIEAIVNDFASR